jgi:hypothetical protein
MVEKTIWLSSPGRTSDRLCPLDGGEDHLALLLQVELQIGSVL